MPHLNGTNDLSTTKTITPLLVPEARLTGMVDKNRKSPSQDPAPSPEDLNDPLMMDCTYLTCQDLDVSLEADPDTSMVESLGLHLISEHDVPDSLALNEEDAASLHEHLHLQQELAHGPTDWRFRVHRGMRVVIKDVETIHALQNGGLTEALTTRADSKDDAGQSDTKTS